ncbi:MAG: alkaline phosphatase family protein [Acidobacteriota bacterium]
MKRLLIIFACIGAGLLSGCRGVGLLPAQPPVVPTATITASPATVAPGSSATLSWTTAYASTVTIDNGIGAVPLSGSMPVAPSATTQYTLTATSVNGTATSIATVTVKTLPPTVKFSAAPNSIMPGNSATLTWSTTNATTVTIDHGIGTVAASGSTTVSPTSTTTYTLTATGSGGTVTATANVTVQQIMPTARLTASPSTITAGQTSTLTWSTTGATTVSINQGIGVVSASGSTVVSPTDTTLYTLTATGIGGTATASTTVTVGRSGTTNSPITHLIILMMQNHTLDNLFGTFPGVNGLDATLPSYHQVDAAGNTVSPTPVTSLSVADLAHSQPKYAASWDNGAMDKFAFVEGDEAMQYYDSSLSGLATDKKPYGISTIWNYAKKYALADNFYMSVMSSEPAQELELVSATVDSERTSGSLPFYDPCSAVEQQRNGGGTIAVPLTETNVGDQLTAKQISWEYSEINFDTSQNGTCMDYVPQEEPFQYFTTTANSEHTTTFTMASFNNMLTAGTLPSVYWIQPDGAKDMHPGAGNILDGVEFADNIVQAVKNSGEWQSTAIIVLFDESGGWYDHVAPPQLSGNPFGVGGQGLGMRVPVMVISPYAKTNYISHQQMDFVSILRFIQWNWNLGEIPAAIQHAREQQSGDICDLLSTTCGAPSP